MANIFVVQEVVTLSTIYVAVPYGQQQPSGGVSFSGTSAIGEASLGLAEIGLTRCLIKTGIFSGIQPLLGVVRWGFLGTDSGGNELFVEKGWDFLKAGGKVIDYADLPSGRSLDVRVRWNRNAIDWSCLYS